MDDEESSDSSVSVAEWVDFFEFVVGSCGEFAGVHDFFGFFVPVDELLHEFWDVLPVGWYVVSDANKVVSEFACDVWFGFEEEFCVPVEDEVEREFFFFFKDEEECFGVVF